LVRKGDAALRSGPRRAAARATIAVLLAGAIWGGLSAISAYFYRGPLAVPVKRAELVVTISGQGVVESGDRLDVKCRVRGWRNILEIAPEGSYVRQGDVVVRLGAVSLENALKAERVALAKAEASAAAAKKSCEAAELAIEEYREGTYVQERQKLARVILLAEQKLKSTERALVEMKILHRQSFVPRSHVDALEAAVDKAKSELLLAETKKKVLEGYTRKKTLAELTAQRDAAAVQLRSAEVVIQTQSSKIAKLEEDLRNCVIRAPRDGMVLYAEDAAPGENAANEPGPAIYPGARVRQFQTLVQLAGLGRMQVKMLVPEDKRSRLRRGQRSHVSVLDREFHGRVASIGDRPERSSLPVDALKRYAVIIAIEGSEPMKLGKTADVEILVQHKPDVLVVPVTSVIDDDGRSRVLLKERGRLQPREVMLGIADDYMIEVVDGLRENDLVLLTPPP
jgi:HlyD family secretion protein